MEDKLKMISSLFTDKVTESVPSEPGQSTPLRSGKYYGGIYNGRKYLYSEQMIQTLSIEKLESFIKKQMAYD